jgi:hypothetical protein
MPEKKLVSVLTLFYHRQLPPFGFTDPYPLAPRSTPVIVAIAATWAG